MHDFYFGDGDWPYPLGAIQMNGKSLLDVMRCRRQALTAGRPQVNNGKRSASGPRVARSPSRRGRRPVPFIA